MYPSTFNYIMCLIICMTFKKLTCMCSVYSVYNYVDKSVAVIDSYIMDVYIHVYRHMPWNMNYTCISLDAAIGVCS